VAELTKILKDSSGEIINTLTLRFNNQQIEKQFKIEYYLKSIKEFRVAFLLLIGLYAGFGLLDYYTENEIYKLFFTIRYAIVSPLLIVVLIISFHKNFIKIWQQFIAFSFLVGGLGIIFMIHQTPDNIFYYCGMFLIFIAGYFAIKLQFYWAATTSILLIVCYNLGATYYIAHNPFYIQYILIINAFYISAILIAMFALYNIELLERKGFYQRLLLSEKQDEIVQINRSLETQVTERTKLLVDRNNDLEEQIKQRKEVEKKLYHAKEKAEESDRLKSAFLSNMSHEIRTPMNGILGFVDLLQMPDISTDDQQKYLEVVTQSGKRLLNTINDIIEISKIESGQTQLNLSSKNLNEILTFQYQFFKPEADSKGLELLIIPIEPDITIVTDINKFESILMNLIKNALKFTKSGRIEFGGNIANNKILLYVKDTGQGIPQNRLNHIFNRFEQAELNINRGHEGSGLGLSIAKAYSEILGGELWVKSEVGLGSTFFFDMDYNLPKIKNSDVENKKEDIKSEIGNPLILIAEDDEVSFSLMKAILSKEKCRFIWVENGKLAIEKCQENINIDLILMDLKMPVMDGLEATRQIRSFNKDIIIIAQTAYAIEGDKEKAIEAGCNDYISKPISSELLLKKIRKYI